MILICTALDEEARILDSLKKEYSEQLGVAFDCVVLGMGKVAAQQSLENYLKVHSVRAVLLIGFAGGLDPALNGGEVVLYHSPGKQSEFPGLEKLSSSFVHKGSYFCHDTIVETSNDKMGFYEKTKASAVDMESGVVEEICINTGVPMVCLKAISDDAHSDLPIDFARWTHESGSLNLFGLVIHILIHPWKIPAMIRLGSTSNIGKRNLKNVLHLWGSHVFQLEKTKY